MLSAILAVAIGGALGSLFRWFLGLQLNGLFPDLPLGALLANLIAAYVIGLSVALFQRFVDCPVEWRLFTITSVLGRLSTFSTFSAEVVSHLESGRTLWAFAEIAANLLGSLLLTTLGIATIGIVIR